MKRQGNGVCEYDAECRQRDHKELAVMNLADFEMACQELHDQRAAERASYCVHSCDEIQKHNLALASQCVSYGLPLQIVYHVYCCVDARICACVNNEFTLTQALELQGYMFSQYAALIREVIPTKPAYSEIVERTFFLLDDAFGQEPVPKDLGVQMIARRLNVSPNYLSSRFAREAGVTLTKYVTRRRLRRAGFLLLNTTLSVAEIAEQVGFSDSAYYSDVSKRFTGLSPTQYRERQRTERIL